VPVPCQTRNHGLTFAFTPCLERRYESPDSWDGSRLGSGDPRGQGAEQRKHRRSTDLVERGEPDQTSAGLPSRCHLTATTPRASTGSRPSRPHWSRTIARCERRSPTWTTSNLTQVGLVRLELQPDGCRDFTNELLVDNLRVLACVAVPHPARNTTPPQSASCELALRQLRCLLTLPIPRRDRHRASADQAEMEITRVS
jgi:hypothetical protein